MINIILTIDKIEFKVLENLHILSLLFKMYIIKVILYFIANQFYILFCQLK